jgi:putative exosortase-associated protein (TIGR04073 family)
MHRAVWVKTIGLVVVLGVAFGPVAGWAQSYDPDQDIPKPTKTQKRAEKLGRGLTNVFFGWSEVPATWVKHVHQGKGLSHLLIASPIIGFTKAFIRTGVGVYEVVTFPASGRDGKYGPILEPEYIF